MSSTVSYVVGLLYPAYATFKAIKQAEAHRLVDPAWSQETAAGRRRAPATSTAQQNSLRRRRVDVDSLMTQWLMTQRLMKLRLMT